MSEHSSDKQLASFAVPPHPFRFRLLHLLYAIALLSSSLATFGWGGIAPASIVLVVWAYVFISSSRPRALARVCLILLASLWFMPCLLPAVSGSREVARRIVCSNNLRQIGVALHNYHDVYGSFPPAYVPDEKGRPKHSWRVLLLPFLGEKALYNAYNFDQPWNGPNNQKLASKMPNAYVCPIRQLRTIQPDSQTSYVAVVGPHAAWPCATTRTLRQFSDELSKTVMVIEIDSLGINWIELSTRCLRAFGAAAVAMGLNV